jgi:hypothetical protein
MENQEEKNKAANAAALLKKQTDEAKAILKEKQEVLKTLPETATEEEKAAAQLAIDDAKNTLKDLKPGKKDTIKIKFTKSPTGRFNLAYGVGEVAEFEIKQAAELIDAEFAKEVK